jgi:DNA-3-methyladenine glycosylase II
MTDHPSWHPTPDGHRRLLTDHQGSTWLATIIGTQLLLTPLTGETAPPGPSLYRSPADPRRPSPLAAPLSTLGVVARLPNPSLWDAMATAIVRQVIRASQARRLYREFSRSFGFRIALSADTDIHAFPSPNRVLALSDEDFTQSGMAFKKRPLRHAAEAFLSRGSTWLELAPAVLVKELQTVGGIGPWSAGAAVADWSNDWSLYPYGDLAVRTWARQAAPDHPWPSDEPAFHRSWRQVTGDHLGSCTLLTLAWGIRQGAAL